MLCSSFQYGGFLCHSFWRQFLLVSVWWYGKPFKMTALCFHIYCYFNLARKLSFFNMAAKQTHQHGLDNPWWDHHSVTACLLCSDLCLTAWCPAETRPPLRPPHHPPDRRYCLETRRRSAHAVVHSCEPESK